MPPENPTTTTTPPVVTWLHVSLLIVAGIGIIWGYNYTVASTTSLSQVSKITHDSFIEDSANNAVYSPLEAKAAIILSETGDVLFSKNASAQYPLASLTKLITAYVAARDLSPELPITIPSEAVPDPELSLIQPREHWTVGQLITMALVASSNEAANSLCYAIGQHSLHVTNVTFDSATNACITELRRTAQKMGLATTYFANPSGLDLHLGVIGGAYGSPRDIAQLFLAAIKDFPEQFAITTAPSITLVSPTGREVTIENTNNKLESYPTLRASKTGTTRLSGGNLAIITEHNNTRVAVVVFGSGETSRFADAEQLDNSINQLMSTRIQE